MNNTSQVNRTEKKKAYKVVLLNTVVSHTKRANLDGEAEAVDDVSDVASNYFYRTDR